ncbi:hypothetical protein V3N99_12995 [Dermatophilaceae bacterium Soc4.6]
MTMPAAARYPLDLPLELHGPASEWSRCSTLVRVVTAEPGALRPARRLVDDVLAGMDLTADGRPRAADRCAQVVASRLGVGTLVSLGGDISTAGPAGASADSGWDVLVQDVDGGPASVIAVPTGLALATVAVPGRARWRAVTVVAADCVTARAVATRLLDHPGGGDGSWSVGLPLRAVRLDGTVEVAGGWPADAETGDTPVVDLDDSRDSCRVLGLL